MHDDLELFHYRLTPHRRQRWAHGVFCQLRARVKLNRLSREVLGLWGPSIRLDLTVQVFFVSEMIAHCV